MENKEESARQRASREATEWLILLQEDADCAETRRRFDAWRTADPANEAAWADTKALLGLTAAKAPVHADLWQPFLARSRAAASTPSGRDVKLRAWPRRRLLPVIMTSAIACVLALAIVPAALVRLNSDYMTSTAEQRRVELGDGSEMILAAGSAVAVSLADDRRVVRLIEGEAFFHVKPDHKRPFHVSAGSVNTTVLGTRFDVRRDSLGVSVSVEEGLVQVGPMNDSLFAPERLEAGQFVRVSWKGDTERGIEPPQFVGSWRRGQLVARDESLGNAVDQIRRYFAGTIIVADGSLAERRITGIYDLSDPEEALRGIARAHGARVRRVSPWLLVVTGS